MSYITRPTTIQTNVDKNLIQQISDNEQSKDYYYWDYIRTFHSTIFDQPDTALSIPELFAIKAKIIGSPIICGKNHRSNNFLYAKIFKCELNYSFDSKDQPFLYLEIDAFYYDKEGTWGEYYSFVKGIENNFYIGVDFNLDTYSGSLIVNPEKTNCPLNKGLDIHKCFVKNQFCPIVDPKDCDIYLQLYNLGKKFTTNYNAQAKKISYLNDYCDSHEFGCDDCVLNINDCDGLFSKWAPLKIDTAYEMALAANETST